MFNTMQVRILISCLLYEHLIPKKDCWNGLVGKLSQQLRL
jgi:hypothetical protein